VARGVQYKKTNDASFKTNNGQQAKQNEKGEVMNPVKVIYEYHDDTKAKHFGVYADGYKDPMGLIGIEDIADEDIPEKMTKILV